MTRSIWVPPTAPQIDAHAATDAPTRFPHTNASFTADGLRGIVPAGLARETVNQRGDDALPALPGLLGGDHRGDVEPVVVTVEGREDLRDRAVEKHRDRATELRERAVRLRAEAEAAEREAALHESALVVATAHEDAVLAGLTDAQRAALDVVRANAEKGMP